MSTNTKWWQLICYAKDVEEATGLAMASGASGTEILSSDSFIAYVENEPNSLKESLTLMGVVIHKVSEVPTVNYVQKCEEVWVPITVGRIELLPVLETKNSYITPKKDTLYILPGNGFGTGHHQSTRLALYLLQEPLVNEIPPRRVLDLGTGNGVLGLGAILLHDSIVDAIDTDPLAIENAFENLALNPEMTGKINLIVGEISNASNNYDLILANIYASTLIALESEIYSRLRTGGAAILAGIMTHEASSIENTFHAPRWKIQKQNSEDNWCGFLISKI